MLGKYELNELYNIDCMEGMKPIPDKFFELAIVDVPYGIGEDGSKNKNRGKLAISKDYVSFSGKDLESPPIEYFQELMRISKNQIIFGANHFISKIPFDSSCWIVWDKNNGNTDFADCELAWASFKTAVRKFKYTWQGMLQENMKEKEKRIHPTQKPVALYEWILNNYANKGDKIIDTHVGSGSSLIACYNLGFDYLGFELNEHYYLSAKKRLEQRKSQLDIFNLQGF